MNNIKHKLKERTNYSDLECSIIDDVLNKHFIIGRNNKKKIINDFMEQLHIDEKDSDELYNICCDIIVKGIFERK